MGYTWWGLQLFSLRSRILSGEEPACALPEKLEMEILTRSLSISPLMHERSLPQIEAFPSPL